MADTDPNAEIQGSNKKPNGTAKSRTDRVLEAMDAAGEAIIAFAKIPFAQPKYLTAFGGLLALAGTMFPWTYEIGFVGIEKFTGFTTRAGQPTALFGFVTIVLAIFFAQTKPGKPNSLASSLLALLFVLVFWQLTPNCGDCNNLMPSFGYKLSSVAALLTFFFGLIPNPRQRAKQ